MSPSSAHTIDVDPNMPGNQVTLRAAIENYDDRIRGNDDDVNIEFALGSGTPVIHVGASTSSPLPTLLAITFDNRTLTVNGHTGGAGRVMLDGAAAGANANGLTIGGGHTVIESLVINGFSQHGIDISGTPPPGDGNNLVRDCYIGLDAAGTAAVGNGGDGIRIEGGTPNNTIGGASTTDRNVISGNGGDGIHIERRNPFAPAPASGDGGNLIQNNFIGPDVSGDVDRGNGGNGVFIEGDAAGDPVKTLNSSVGDAASHGNVISGNGGKGVHIEGNFIAGGSPAGIVVLGNKIGTNAGGTKKLANDAAGVDIVNSPKNSVGSNLISGNGGDAVDVTGQQSSNNLVQGNIMGLTADGSKALVNGGDGVVNDNAPQTQIDNNKIEDDDIAVLIKGFASDGIGIEANALGKDGSGVRLKTGVKFIQGGARLFVNGNAIFNSDIAQIDVFAEADGDYTITNNKFGRGSLTSGANIGTKVAFSRAGSFTLSYGTNQDLGDKVALKYDETVGGKFDVSVFNNVSQTDVAGGQMSIFGSGLKDLHNNRWVARAGDAFDYNVDLGAGAQVRFNQSAELYMNSGGGGNIGTLKVAAGAIFSESILDIVASSNAADAVSIVALATINGQVDITGRRIRSTLNGGVGIGIRAGSSVIGVTVTDSIFDHNVKPSFVLGVSSDHSITNNSFTNITGGAGLIIGGASNVHFNGNTITGNSGDGVQLTNGAAAAIDSGNTIANNGGDGIEIDDTATATIQGNNIQGNGGDGVNVKSTGAGVAVQDNTISGNGLLGIDLNGDGVTANDAGDGDGGPNGLQNFPVISTVTTNASGTAIVGVLNSKASSTFTLRFFSNATKDGSGFGEGEVFIGSTSVVTNAGGNASFTFNPTSPVAAGRFVCATATNAAGQTSEFSADVAVNGGGGGNHAPTLGAIAGKSVSEGSKLTFTATASDPDAAQTLAFSLDAGAPAGAAIDASTGAFSFTPADGPAVFNVTVRVTDNGSPKLSDAKSFAITVNNVPPAANAGPDQSVLVGKLVSLAGTFKDPGKLDTQKFNWHLAASNGQVVPDGSAQNFSFTPSAAGTYTATFTVTDKDGGVGKDSAVITVGAVAVAPIVRHFTLINATTDRDIRALHDNDVIVLFNTGTSLNVRADTTPSITGSVRFAFDGNAAFHTENFHPYALFGDDNGNYRVGSFSIGMHTLTATPFSLANGGGVAGTPVTVHFRVVQKPLIAGLTLINTDNSSAIGSLSNGSTLTLSKLPPHLNVRADAVPPFVGSVKFDLDGTFVRTENGVPYSLFGDAGVMDFNPGTFKIGKHKLTVTPFSGRSGAGTAFDPLIVVFTVV